jgi:hypothetical protein
LSDETGVAVGDQLVLRIEAAINHLHLAGLTVSGGGEADASATVSAIADQNCTP